MCFLCYSWWFIQSALCFQMLKQMIRTVTAEDFAPRHSFWVTLLTVVAVVEQFHFPFLGGHNSTRPPPPIVGQNLLIHEVFDVITSFFSGYMFGAGTTAHRYTRTVIRVP